MTKEIRKLCKLLKIDMPEIVYIKGLLEVRGQFSDQLRDRLKEQLNLSSFTDLVEIGIRFKKRPFSLPNIIQFKL